MIEMVIWNFLKRAQKLYRSEIFGDQIQIRNESFMNFNSNSGYYTIYIKTCINSNQIKIMNSIYNLNYCSLFPR